MNHHRRSIRLRDYDYTQSGAYFVTVCTHERVCLFGDVVNGAIVLSACGEVVQNCWDVIPEHVPHVELDAFVVMPNHIHGILVITHNHEDTTRRGMIYHAPTTTDAPTATNHAPTTDAPTPHAATPPRKFAQPIANSLSTMIGTFKAAVTRQINRLGAQESTPIWQRNYYEHIIRDNADLDRIRAYVETNPGRWQEDSLFPS